MKNLILFIFVASLLLMTTACSDSIEDSMPEEVAQRTQKILNQKVPNSNAKCISTSFVEAIKDKRYEGINMCTTSLTTKVLYQEYYVLRDGDDWQWLATGSRWQ